MTGRYAEPPQPGRHQVGDGDLALLADGDGGQVFWRSCCRLTALFCRNEDVAFPHAYALACMPFGCRDRQFALKFILGCAVAGSARLGSVLAGYVAGQAVQLLAAVL